MPVSHQVTMFKMKQFFKFISIFRQSKLLLMPLLTLLLLLILSSTYISILRVQQSFHFCWDSNDIALLCCSCPESEPPAVFLQNANSAEKLQKYSRILPLCSFFVGAKKIYERFALYRPVHRLADCFLLILLGP